MENETLIAAISSREHDLARVQIAAQAHVIDAVKN